MSSNFVTNFYVRPWRVAVAAGTVLDDGAGGDDTPCRLYRTTDTAGPPAHTARQVIGTHSELPKA